jgi:hypothetical protein
MDDIIPADAGQALRLAFQPRDQFANAGTAERQVDEGIRPIEMFPEGGHVRRLPYHDGTAGGTLEKAKAQFFLAARLPLLVGLGPVGEEETAALDEIAELQPVFRWILDRDVATEGIVEIKKPSLTGQVQQGVMGSGVAAPHVENVDDPFHRRVSWVKGQGIDPRRLVKHGAARSLRQTRHRALAIGEDDVEASSKANWDLSRPKSRAQISSSQQAARPQRSRQPGRALRAAASVANWKTAKKSS